VAISKYLRFSGGPPTPTVPGLTPSPGEAIIAHLKATLPAFGVRVLGHEDVEYAHELKCTVHARTYCVSVSYDWVSAGWWEVFWNPVIGLIGKLRGQSEDEELRCLATAVSQSLDSLPGILERRWYKAYGVGVGPEAPYSHAPQLD